VLTFGDLQSDELAVLLAGMPQLSSLALSGWLLGWRELCTLHFLATALLAASRTTLKLFGCRALPLEELEHIHGLKRLRSLVIQESFAALLPLDVQRHLTPGDGALLLPELTEFSYTPGSYAAPAGGSEEDGSEVETKDECE